MNWHEKQFESRLREDLQRLAAEAPDPPRGEEVRRTWRRRRAQRMAVLSVPLLAAWVLLSFGPDGTVSRPADAPRRTGPTAIPSDVGCEGVLEGVSRYLASVGIEVATVEKDPGAGVSFTLEGQPRVSTRRLHADLNGLLAHYLRISVRVSRRPEACGAMVMTN